jgi:hypothetical protein
VAASEASGTDHELGQELTARLKKTELADRDGSGRPITVCGRARQERVIRLLGRQYCRREPCQASFYDRGVMLATAAVRFATPSFA